MTPPLGTAGETYIDQILGEYVPPETSFAEDLVNDEEKQLLYAILVEMRASRIMDGEMDVDSILEEYREAVEQGRPQSEATYVSGAEDVSVLEDQDDWKPVEFDFVASEIDLRGFGTDIYVAFREPKEQSAIVPYTADEAPVVGVPVSTSKMWIAAQEGTGGTTITYEAWADA